MTFGVAGLISSDYQFLDLHINEGSLTMAELLKKSTFHKEAQNILKSYRIVGKICL